jgi:hypothetical protein
MINGFGMRIKRNKLHNVVFFGAKSQYWPLNIDEDGTKAKIFEFIPPTTTMNGGRTRFLYDFLSLRLNATKNSADDL